MRQPTAALPQLADLGGQIQTVRADQDLDRGAQGMQVVPEAGDQALLLGRGPQREVDRRGHRDQGHTVTAQVDDPSISDRLRGQPQRRGAAPRLAGGVRASPAGPARARGAGLGAEPRRGRVHGLGYGDAVAWCDRCRIAASSIRSREIPSRCPSARTAALAPNGIATATNTATGTTARVRVQVA